MNPQCWDTGNPAAGRWSHYHNYTQNGASVQDRRSFVFLSDRPGSPFSISASEVFKSGVDFVRNDYAYQGIVTGCDSAGLSLNARLTSCTVTGTVAPPCVRPVRIADGRFSLQSHLSGTFSSPTGSINVSRFGGFSFEDHPIELDDVDVAPFTASHPLPDTTPIERDEDSQRFADLSIAMLQEAARSRETDEDTDTVIT